MSDVKSLNSESIKIDGARKSELEISKQRVIAVSVVFFVISSLIVMKLFYVSTNPSIIQAKTNQINPSVIRGNILDRNGKILATSLPSYSLYMDGTKVKDSHNLLKKLSYIVPNLNEDKIIEKISKKKKFIYIKRQLSPKLAGQINLLGEPSLDFKIEPLRVYPYENKTGYFVGYMGVDSIPHAGIERSFNETLEKGNDIILTIDIRLQSILFNKLEEGLEKFKAKSAVGIILNINSGEILSSVSFPDFNPNLRSQHKFGGGDDNKVTMANYEMGSIFKSFTIASALNEDLITLDSTFDATKPLKLKGMTVRDFHAKNKILNLKEVFLYSSNIGSSLIAMQLGKERQNHYFDELGLTKKLNIGISEISKPSIPNSYTEPDIATRSYGYGIAVNPLQVISALAATVNGGKYIEPILVDDPFLRNRASVQVFKPEVSEIMKDLYRSVVADEGGTASKINIKEYKIGGKTGTANINENGEYNTKRSISSFVSFFPINNPIYGIFVLLDSPNPDKKEQATAGWTAVPISRDIIKGIAPILAEPSVELNIGNNLN